MPEHLRAELDGRLGHDAKRARLDSVHLRYDVRR